MKCNFKEIEYIDIDGKVDEMATMYHTVADLIYRLTQNLDLVDIALQINRGEEVDLRPADIKEIKRIVNDPKSGMFAFARKAVLEFLDGKKEKEKS